MVGLASPGKGVGGEGELEMSRGGGQKKGLVGGGGGGGNGCIRTTKKVFSCKCGKRMSKILNQREK